MTSSSQFLEAAWWRRRPETCLRVYAVVRLLSPGDESGVGRSLPLAKLEVGKMVWRRASLSLYDRRRWHRRNDVRLAIIASWTGDPEPESRSTAAWECRA